MNKTLNYLKESIFINLRSFVEYKTNTYMGVFFSFIYLFSLLIFGIVMVSNFNSIINWQFEQVLYFVLISGFWATLAGIFCFNFTLPSVLLKGNLNSYLTKPINVFIQYQMNSLSISFFGSFLMYILTIIFYLIYFNSIIDFFNLLKSLFFGIFGMLFLILIFKLIESLSFFIKKTLSLLKIVMVPQKMFDIYPASLFEGGIKIITYFFANVFYGFYSVQILFGRINLEEFLFLLFYEIIICFVLFFIVVFIWKKGLQKYEAFG